MEIKSRNTRNPREFKVCHPVIIPKNSSARIRVSTSKKAKLLEYPSNDSDQVFQPFKLVRPIKILFRLASGPTSFWADHPPGKWRKAQLLFISLALEAGTHKVLEGPNNVLIEKSLHFNFKTSNNQVEYESIIVGLNLANQYYHIVTTFAEVKLEHIPQANNMRASVLSKLVRTKKKDMYKSLLQQVLSTSFIDAMSECMVIDLGEEMCMELNVRYLKTEDVPEGEDKY
ncbi:hypothetical protein V8G54_024502 [Vigna mungo]|uniref:Reverse transcriptase RNase H-like domain-containing protein n=1 Tax=Vigna mungo TaxID=3915 RepID=A0AAQ3N7C2_VIGMU